MGGRELLFRQGNGLDAQADAPFGAVHAHDACLDRIADVQHIAHLLDVVLAELREIQRGAFSETINRIRNRGWTETEHIQWVHVHESFEPMGVKMIGAFLDSIRNSRDADPQKYLAGFQIVPNRIPGIGAFDFSQVKISMRVADAMEEGIRRGEVLGLDVLLPEATSRVGGFSDACHSLTAATTVPVGREEELIDEMEKVLAEWQSAP